MNKNTRKALTALISVALLLLTATGTTLAYLLDRTDTLNNIFLPGQVSCAVVENGQNYTSDVVSISQKSNVTVKNTGTVSAYIRAAVLVTWKSEGGVVYATAPEEEAYTLQIGSDWSFQDGFYYYQSDVASESTTSPLITSAKQLQQGPVGPDGTQYYLSVEIIAEAIQAEGMNATTAQAAWAAAEAAKEGQS